MSDATRFVDAAVPPSGPGCVECTGAGGWWLHLRRCAACGHVGCCDDSLGRHATAHFESSGHRVMQSFEPGEDWFWDYGTDDYTTAPALAAPDSHPQTQTTPGPAERVPADWMAQLSAR